MSDGFLNLVLFTIKIKNFIKGCFTQIKPHGFFHIPLVVSIHADSLHFFAQVLDDLFLRFLKNNGVNWILFVKYDI